VVSVKDAPLKSVKKETNNAEKKPNEQKDMGTYKNLLVKQKIDLLKGYTNLTNESLKQSQRDASGDLSGYTYHMADMASDVYERDFLLQLASGERDLLLKIDDALKRIEDGTYGFCVSCKKKIANTRLKAIPHALYCRDCQEQEEKKDKRK